jgi:hypothetical protein
MRTEIKKVYYCEYCKIHRLSASTISRHEKYCKSNPKNAHKCFEFCRYLEKTQSTRFTEDGEPYSRNTSFKCLKNNTQMYSFHLEKIASLYPYNNITKGLIRMPLECDKFEIMDIDEDNGQYVKD